MATALQFFLALLQALRWANAFGPPNEIIGSPNIECNPDDVSFAFVTSKPFRGNVYIRGHFEEANCRRAYDTNADAAAQLIVRIGDCGMKRVRQLQPWGVNYVLTFVANFHPLFATKEDRAFSVRCFYAHSNAVVKADIEVSPIPAESMEKATVVVPQCAYTLHEGTFDGPPVRTTVVGKPIFHRWQCENTGYFGILIRNCAVVDPRAGASVSFLDSAGCPMSSEFPRVEYDATLTSAYAMLEALSFADQSRVSFACQIQLCDKRVNECIGVSPPPCSMVPRTEFMPNSIVNGDVDPTQVISMLEDKHDKLFPLDGGVVESWMKEPKPLEDGESTSSSVELSPMRAFSDAASSTQIPPTSSADPIVFTNDNDLLTNNEVTSNQMPWPIPTHTAEEIQTRNIQYLKRFNAVDSSQKDVREKRLADNVMDVLSEMVVRQKDEFDEGEIDNWNETRWRPPTSAKTTSSSLTCVSDGAVVLVATTLVATSTLAVIVIVYVSRQLFCSRQPADFSDADTVCQSDRSSDVTVISQFPVFSRRLGDPCYSQHLRNFS